MSKRDFDPIHPSEILLEEFLRPLGISQYRLAKDISVPQRRISEITQGKRSVTADTALRLGRYFGMGARFWLNLQSRYDLSCAEAALDSRLEEGESPLPSGNATGNVIRRGPASRTLLNPDPAGCAPPTTNHPRVKVQSSLARKNRASHLHRLAHCLATTNQPDTPLLFKC